MFANLIRKNPSKKLHIKVVLGYNLKSLKSIISSLHPYFPLSKVNTKE